MLGFGTLISHGFGLSLAPAMLPRISDDLVVGYSALGAALAVGLVAYAVGSVSAGWILDRVASRGLLMATYAITAAGLLIAGAATSAVTLAAGTAVTGFIAPVSWAVTLHVAGTTIARQHRATVMASASGGAALGVLLNGVLVQTSDSLHSWRLSFVIAALIALAPIVGARIVYRRPIGLPESPGTAPRLRTSLKTRPGRLIVVTSSAAGIIGFPFSTFLTATAIDEMQASAFAAGVLWWLVGLFGMAAGPAIGGYGDRRTPLHALRALSLAYLAGLVVLVVFWSYAGLMITVIGFALMNYPVWGVLGAAASHDFDSASAVRAITLGLTGAALMGAIGNAVAGAWLEATGSFRGPMTAITALTAALAIWYWRETQRGAD